MTGAAIRVEDKGFEEALAAIEGVEHLEQGELLDALGRLFQESTRERIEVTKTSPDGASWEPNRRGSPTLRDSGNLAASIDVQVHGASVAIGTALVYGAIHQFGGTIRPKNANRLVFQIGNQLVFATKVTIPARPYLGVSADDADEALQMVADTLSELFH